MFKMFSLLNLDVLSTDDPYPTLVNIYSLNAQNARQQRHIETKALTPLLIQFLINFNDALFFP